MSNQDSARIYTIWTNVMIDGEPAKVSIVNSMAKILFSSCGFDIPIPGKFYDVASVVRAYVEQQKMIRKSLENQTGGEKHLSWESPAGTDLAAELNLPEQKDTPYWDVPKCLVPISEDELDKLVDGWTMVEDLSKNGED